MLVKFSSPKTESVIMFGDTAIQLIRMLGGSGNVPGAMEADDLPAAIDRLQAGLRSKRAADAPADSDDSRSDDTDREPPIALSMRAGPLLAILERASAAHAPVMWEPLAG